MTTTDWM